ncbi:hypothetical protein OEZ86_002257 [Tetradesmus obliquus]|nr:hypothetical protein OEZ86_002257 [Tetradesmus obliquus]
MPDAVNLAGYATNGSWYDILRASAQASNPGSVFGPGVATYTYPVSQRPAQLWFHDHVLGITRLNVYSSLAGFFMVRNAFPQNGPELPGLPYLPPGMGPDSAVRELPLAIQDRAFDTSNQLYYPKQTTLPAADALPNGPVPPTWVPEFFASLPDGSDATLMTVNGRVAPRHDVAKEPYRLRILNGCNAKSLIIYFSTTQPTVGAEVVTSGVLPFWVVGNEAGFFPSLVGPVTQVLLGPAERYDVIFDFSTVPGNAGSVYMLNKGPGVPFNGANVGGGTTIHQAQAMRFDVLKSPNSITFDKARRATLDAALRAEYNKAPTQLPAAPSRTRQFALLEYFGSNGNPMGQFIGNVDATNPAALQGVKQTWMDPVAAVTGTDAVEQWTIINLTGDAHPIHMHKGLFEVVTQEEVVKQEAVTISPTGAFTFTGQLGLPAGLLDG